MKFFEYISNTTAAGCAMIATITQEDLRLWVVALSSLFITFAASHHRRYKDKLDAQKSRTDLCKSCIDHSALPHDCVVKDEHRPNNCPLKQKES